MKHLTDKNVLQNHCGYIIFFRSLREVSVQSCITIFSEADASHS